MKRESKKFLILGILFIFIWAFHMLVVSPFITNNFDEILANIIKTILKFVIWCGFGFYFINKYNKDLSLKKEKLFQFVNIGFLIKLILMVIITAFIAMLSSHKGFNINSFTIDDFFNKFLLVGLEEEIVFRALILNGLSKKEKFTVASVITGILFALVHVPIYIRNELGFSLILINLLKITIVSMVYNYIFKESKSLWHILVVHSLWDLLFFLFVE